MEDITMLRLLRLSTLISLFVLVSLSAMATDKYFNDVSGNNYNTLANWFTDSTFTVGATSLPNGGDNIYITAASGAGTITVNVTSYCKSAIFSGFSGTFAGTYQLTISGDLLLSPTMTITHSSTLSFNANADCYINTAGKTITSSVYINIGTTNTLKLLSHFTSTNTSINAVLLSQGIFDLNGYNLTTQFFVTSGSYTRRMIIGASVVTCTGITYGAGASAWRYTGSGFILDSHTGVIRLTQCVNFIGGNISTYNRIEMKSSGSTKTFDSNISGAMTIGDLIIEVGGTGTWGVYIDHDITVTDTMKFTGTSALLASSLRGNDSTTHINITSGTYVLDYINFNNIHLSPSFDASALTISDMGENTGITFRTPVKRYWVGNSGNWGATSEWSTTSGGSSGASWPTAGDTAVFDALSFSATGSITINVAYIPAIDLRNIDQTVTFQESSLYVIICCGDVIYSSNTIPTAKLFFIGRNIDYTYNLNGAERHGSINIDIHAGKMSLTSSAQINPSYSNAVNCFTGTLDVQSDILLQLINVDLSSKYGATINANSHTITINGTSYWFDFLATTVFNCGTSTINVTGQKIGSDATVRTYQDLTYYNLIISPASVPPYYWILDNYNNTILNDFTVNNGARIKFRSGKLFTVNGEMTMMGTSTNKVYIRGSTTSVATISKASGNVCCDYLDIDYSTATGGATFKAGANSTDGTHNSGWSFTSCAGAVYNFLIHGTSF